MARDVRIKDNNIIAENGEILRLQKETTELWNWLGATIVKSASLHSA